MAHAVKDLGFQACPGVKLWSSSSLVFTFLGAEQFETISERAVFYQCGSPCVAFPESHWKCFQIFGVQLYIYLERVIVCLGEGRSRYFSCNILIYWELILWEMTHIYLNLNFSLTRQKQNMSITKLALIPSPHPLDSSCSPVISFFSAVSFAGWWWRRPGHSQEQLLLLSRKQSGAYSPCQVLTGNGV